MYTILIYSALIWFLILLPIFLIYFNLIYRMARMEEDRQKKLEGRRWDVDQLSYVNLWMRIIIISISFYSFTK